MKLITNGMLHASTPAAASPVSASALDPYAEIEKVPLQTHDGMKSRGYTDRVHGLTEEM